MGRQACRRDPLPDPPDSSFQPLFQWMKLALATRMSPRRVMEEFLQVWTWQLGASQLAGGGCLRGGGGGGGELAERSEERQNAGNPD